MPERKSSVIVNGEMVQNLRAKCGWTQRDLAQRSGYSERVIRKAESTGSLKFQTLKDITRTFQSFGIEVCVEELIFDQLAVARAIVESFDALGCEMLSVCAQHLSDDLEVQCAAGSSNVPFAGTWRGPQAMQSFLDRYFSAFQRESGTICPVYLMAENRVVARFDETLTFQGHVLPSFFVNLHFHFQGAVVASLDFECNLHLAHIQCGCAK